MLRVAVRVELERAVAAAGAAAVRSALLAAGTSLHVVLFHAPRRISRCRNLDDIRLASTASAALSVCAYAQVGMALGSVSHL